MDIAGKLGFVVLCLALPVAWGALVNVLFDLWQNRQAEDVDEPIFPDYQI